MKFMPFCVYDFMIFSSNSRILICHSYIFLYLSVLPILSVVSFFFVISVSFLFTPFFYRQMLNPVKKITLFFGLLFPLKIPLAHLSFDYICQILRNFLNFFPIISTEVFILDFKLTNSSLFCFYIL